MDPLLKTDANMTCWPWDAAIAARNTGPHKAHPEVLQPILHQATYLQEAQGASRSPAKQDILAAGSLKGLMKKFSCQATSGCCCKEFRTKRFVSSADQGLAPESRPYKIFG